MVEVAEIKNQLSRKKRDKKRSVSPELSANDKKLKPNPEVANFMDIHVEYDQALLQREVASLEDLIEVKCGIFMHRPDWDRGAHSVSYARDPFANIWDIVKRGNKNANFAFPSLYSRLMTILIRLLVASRGMVSVRSNIQEAQRLVKHRRNNYRVDAILYLNPKVLLYKNRETAIEGISELSEEVKFNGSRTQQFHFICSAGGRHLYFTLQLNDSVRVRGLKEWWIHYQSTHSIEPHFKEFIFRFRIDGHAVEDDTLICHLPPKIDHVRTVEVLPVSLPLPVICLHAAIMTQTDDVYKLFVDMLNPKYRMDHVPIAFYLDALSSKFSLHHKSMLFGLLPLIDRMVLSKASDIYIAVCTSLRSELTVDLVIVIVVHYLGWPEPPMTQLPSNFKWDGTHVMDPERSS